MAREETVNGIRLVLKNNHEWSQSNKNHTRGDFMKKHGYLTISIDDGHLTDLKTAELLQKFGFNATFYMPAHNPEHDMVSPHLIAEIAKHFEIGSHTLNHSVLTYLTYREAYAEINDGKKWLEDLIGKNVIAFCYPRGKFNKRTKKMVEEAGFLGARTCMLNLNDFPSDPFLWGVSTHGYSHTAVVQVRHILLERNFQGIWNFGLIHKLTRNWCKHFKHAVDFVTEYGGIAHLYFHSWEIEEQGQWCELENLFKDISQNKVLARVTNGDLFRLWYNREAHV